MAWELLRCFCFVCCCSVAQSCLTFCNPMGCSMPSFPVLHYLSKLAKLHIYGDQWCYNHLILCCSLSHCPESSPALGFFPVNQLFASGVQNIADSALILPMNIQGWFFFFSGLTSLIFLLSKGLSIVFFSTITWKHQFFNSQPSIWSKCQSVHDYWKNHSFDYMGLCQQSGVSAF